VERFMAAAFDATEEAADGLALAKLLAPLTGDTLEVVRVFVESAGLDPESQRELSQGVRKTREAVDRALPGVHPDLATVVDHSTAHALTSVTKQPDVAVLVLGSTHRGRVGRLVLGMGAEYVLPHASCPVAIAPAGFRDAPALDPPVVGVAYDGSASARAAAGVGARLAVAGGMRLRVIRVVRRRDARAAEELEAVRRDLIDHHPGLEVDAVVDHGNPVSKLAAETARNVGLMLAGGHPHRAMRRVMLGTVATGLVRTARSPLIIVPAR
jgi:nucleotide-binding universal stress UspA family protein